MSAACLSHVSKVELQGVPKEAHVSPAALFITSSSFGLEPKYLLDAYLIDVFLLKGKEKSGFIF